MVPFPPTAPLTQVQAWLRSQADTGIICPCCKQHVKVYRRKLNSGMAHSLIAMYVVGGTDFIHLPTTIGARHREEGKLRYWGLVEEEKARRPDGGRPGYWKVTAVGADFVLGHVSVHKYARIYAGRCLGVGGDLITIREALGDAFSYDELMGTTS